MQRLERKAEFLVAPDRRAGHAPDRCVLIEGEAGEDAWQRRFRLLERLRGQFDRHLHHSVGGERNGLAERFGGGGAAADRASEAASAPPTASCKNSRRCLSAIVFFIRSPPNRTAQRRPDAASFPAKMKNQPLRRRKTRRKPGAFRPWRFRLYIVFCGAARRILPPGEMTSMRVAPRLETAFARGDIGEPDRSRRRFDAAEPRCATAP